MARRFIFIAIPREDDSDEVFDATIDARALTLDSVFEKVGQKQCYTYDFGDDWRHEVRLEEIAEGAKSGCVVVASKGKCPPEDCGGAWGYEDLKKTLLDPKARGAQGNPGVALPRRGLRLGPEGTGQPSGRRRR